MNQLNLLGSPRIVYGAGKDFKPTNPNPLCCITTPKAGSCLISSLPKQFVKSLPRLQLGAILPSNRLRTCGSVVRLFLAIYRLE